MCGSGKSEAVKYFTENGYSKVYFGDVVINELKMRGLEINESNERMVREELRNKFGMGVMAMKSIDAIRNYLKDGNVVIESLYSWEEFKYLKNEFGTGIKLLTVYTTKELRYKRLSEREFRPLTNQQAVSRDISEIENLDKGGPIAYSDYLVINDSGLTELKNNLKKYI